MGAARNSSIARRIAHNELYNEEELVTILTICERGVSARWILPNEMIRPPLSSGLFASQQ